MSVDRSLHVCWIDEETTYDGSQLRSHFAHGVSGLVGDAVVGFVGPCDVGPSALVDLEDRRADAVIRSRSMLHVLVEHFDATLDVAILRQRLLVAIAADVVALRGVARPLRRGDDLFHDDRKLSVSIATASPVSTLVHLGLNVDAEGAPVPAATLAELGVEPETLWRELAERYDSELRGAAHARAKVRAVP